MSTQRGAVADYEKLPSSTRKGHIHTPDVSEEADLTFPIEAHQGENYGFFLSTLKPVHAIDVQPRDRQQLTQEPHLSRVRRHHRHVGGSQSKSA